MKLTSLTSQFKGRFEFLSHRTKEAWTWAAIWKDGTCVWVWRSRFTFRLQAPCALFCFLPRKGFFCFRAQEIAWIFPSVPRTPNPPGTSTPLFKRREHSRVTPPTSPACSDHPRAISKTQKPWSYPYTLLLGYVCDFRLPTSWMETLRT